MYESFIGRAVQIFTPPTASTVFMKLVKSTSR